MQAAVKQTEAIAQSITYEHSNSVECQLKELWSKYVKHIEEVGFDDTARSIRESYFNIYRRYRNNKKWREYMNY